MDIWIKKTWVTSSGSPSISESDIQTLPLPSTIAAVPSTIPFIVPKLMIKIGDHVAIGTPLFQDKKRPNLKFLSPAAGYVQSITYGPKRMIREIIIARDQNEDWIKFPIIDHAGLMSMSPQDLIQHLINGGVWPYLRQLPFRNIADPHKSPPAVWVILQSADPYQQFPWIDLKETRFFFEMGLAALKKLSKAVHVCQTRLSVAHSSAFNSFVTHWISGGYPCLDPGVLVYHTKKTIDENRSWYIFGQDLMAIGAFLTTGMYPTQRVVFVSKPDENKIYCVRTRVGAPLKNILPKDMAGSQNRFFWGGLFTGGSASADSFLGFYDTLVSVLPSLSEKEFFGFLRLGFHKLSLSRTFLSVWNPHIRPLNNDMHGETRACINCGACIKICPVDILPQFLYKSLYAGELEDALEQGLLDCAECGMCSFVCPSKIELTKTFVSAKHDYFLEQA